MLIVFSGKVQASLLLGLLNKELSNIYLWPYNKYLECGNRPCTTDVTKLNFYLQKVMVVQVIQPHKVRKATSVQAAGIYQFDQCTETYWKFVTKYNFED